MLRREFFTLISAVPFIGINNSFKESGKVVHTHKYNGDSNIFIPDYMGFLKLMHITDPHLSVVGEKEKDMMQYAGRMHKGYASPKRHYLQHDKIKRPLEYFEEALENAVSEKVDLLLLTGDIVNFPSVNSVKIIADKLKQTGIPWLYTAGNHDWHYEGMKGDDDYLRKTWIANALMPFYNGHNPLFYSQVIKGINFVGIDNSTYQISEEQLRFLKDQIIREEPIILFSHIPYYFKGIDAIVCGSPEWGAKTDKNYLIERRERWSQKGNSKATIKFVDLIKQASDKIIAIITGHQHRSSVFFTGNLCQYVSFATANGAAPVFKIQGK